ncbi:MAG TPA: class I SAM-dependent methyltransferase [Acidimicrobiales bacterium]|nr:class I SAM-dependent methyltransferase [Acidimicrobiales bacterium]
MSGAGRDRGRAGGPPPPGTAAGARRATSHERMSGAPWDASYRDGPAPWDIGRPQPAVVRLAARGGFDGAVLDAGCGPGDNALHLASLGLAVFGIDVADTALAMARAKAAERGVPVEFAWADALDLGRLGRRFRSVLDCGLFHALDAEERERYVEGLVAVTAVGGTVSVLCFSDEGPGTGPHPVGRDALRSAFASGAWRVDGIDPERLVTRFSEHGAPAWLARITRITPPGRAPRPS